MAKRTGGKDDQKIDLRLTAAERRMIDGLHTIDSGFQQIIDDTPSGQPVRMSFDDWADFGDALEGEANSATDEKVQVKLDVIIEKIDELLDEHLDYETEEATPVEVTRRLAKAIVAAGAGKESGFISLRSQPKPTNKYTVKLTGPQRKSLIQATRIKNQIKKRFKEAPDGTQPFEFTRKEMVHLNGELGSATVHALSPDKKRLVAVQNKIEQLLDEAQLTAFGVRRPKPKPRPKIQSEIVLQFKITLLDIKPAIWRRIQLRDGTLGDLHECIQGSFGWWNYHLHQYLIAGERYGPSEPDGMDLGLNLIDETTVAMCKLLPKSGKRTRWIYEYDFGDGWRHEVLFEGYPTVDAKQKYPICLDGARACPPEDVGGPWGYEEYLEAMADRKHERHAELKEWRGPFDPEAFDAKKATQEIRKIRVRAR